MNTHGVLSGALRPWALRWLACEEPRQRQQVLGRATEDEGPVHLGYTAQFEAAERSSLLHQPKIFSTSRRRLSERAYAECLVVLRSMRERRPLSFF